MAKKSTDSSDEPELPIEEQLDHYRKAGQLAAKIREEIARPLIKPGAKILDICETIEKAIIDQGGGIAFPCNVSVNEIAAHYTSPLFDETVGPTRGAPLSGNQRSARGLGSTVSPRLRRDSRDWPSLVGAGTYTKGVPGA